MKTLPIINSPMKEIVEAVKGTPLLSQSAFHLVSKVSDESYSSKNLVAIIERDSSLTAEILKTVNSATYGLKRAVDSVAQAVFLLG